MGCPTNQPILIGNELTLIGTFTDGVTGALVNPTTVILTVKNPNGAISTFTPAQQSTGIYVYNYTFSIAGIYSYQFAGSGSVIAIAEKQVAVSESLVT